MKSIILILLLFQNISFCQETIPQILKKYNKLTVPYISISELISKKKIILLDSREEKEFNTSHIKNAIHIGFNKFDAKSTTSIIKNQNDTIVVYCSVGVRSENIGEKLKKMGFKNVFNLYGGIFEWKNTGHEVVDNNQAITEKVHVFSKEWSKYLFKGKKIY